RTREAPTRATAAFVLAAGLAALGVGLAGCTVSAPPPATSTTTTTESSANSGASRVPTVDPNEARRQAVMDLVSRRAEALRTKDKAGWLATLSDPAGGFGQRQGEVFDRMVQLPVADFGQRGVEIGPGLPPARLATLGPDAWVSTVHLTYRFDGYDRGPRTYDASLTVVSTPAGWRFADDTDGGTQPQPWDIPSMSVLRSPSTLLVGSAPQARLKEYLETADAAHAQIAKVWGSALPAVIIAPATIDVLSSQLQRSGTGGLDQIAAITDGPIATGAPATTDRVYINPVAFGRLNPDGRRVVVYHELTHVTVRGTTRRPVPIWLSEGFADYVGFNGLNLSPKTVAADLLAKVRAGTGPTRLPEGGDFDPSQGTIAPSYNGAWLAVSRMAKTYGPDKVVAFYQAVAGDLAVDPSIANDPAAVTSQAFGAVLGTTQDAFVADWLGYLKTLAR
ncbi:MAG: hypothetical protein M3Z83_02450, partial [Actinomycetota bacterium]|nr:hypothetical protein [Actinomycetota bacterium]